MLKEKIQDLFQKYPHLEKLENLKDKLNRHLQTKIDEEIKAGINESMAENQLLSNLAELDWWLESSNPNPDDLSRLNKLLDKFAELNMVNEVNLQLDQVDELHLNYRIGDLIIFPTHEDHLIVRDYMSRNISKLYSTVEKVGNVVHLNQGPRKLLGIFQNKTLLFLPTTFSGFLTIRSQTGDIIIDSLQSDCLLDLTEVSGDVLLRNLKLQRLQADLKSGTISIKSCQTNNFHVNAHSGNIIIEDTNIPQTDSELALSTTSGNIKYHGLTAARILIHTKSGNIKGSSLQASLCELQTENGNLNLDSFSAGGTIQSHVGRIKITLATDFKEQLEISNEVGNIKITIPPELPLQFATKNELGPIDLPLSAIIYANDDFNQLSGYLNNEQAPAQIKITNKMGNIKITDKEKATK